MAKDPERVQLEQIDWAGTFPFVRLFEAARIAIWPPGKLLVALLLIALLWIGGGLMDAIAGPRVQPGEIDAFTHASPEEFDGWLERQERTVRNRLYSITADLQPADEEANWGDIVESPDRFAAAREAIAHHFTERHQVLDTQYHEAAKTEELEDRQRRAGLEEGSSATATAAEIYEQRKTDLERQRRDRLASVAALESRGIFATALRFKLDAFERMVGAAIGFRFGFSQLGSPTPIEGDTVLGALRDLAVVLPGWLLNRHPVFLGVWCVFAMALWSLFGGTICRMAALHTTRQEPAPAGEAFRFARQRWFWFFITPWIPLAIALACGVAIALVGVLFNWLLVNIVAGAVFGLLLLLGMVIAMAMIFVALGSGLFYPAIAVEGTDSFDALSRAGSYVFGRFWHWLFYTVIALVHGAVLYLMLGTVVFLTMQVTRFFAGTMIYAQTSDGRNVFDLLLPEPQIGQLHNPVEWGELSVTEVAAAGLIGVWVYLLIGLLAAFAISYYFAAHTWIYLLLRRSADGTEVDEVYIEDQEPPASGDLGEKAAVGMVGEGV